MINTAARAVLAMMLCSASGCASDGTRVEEDRAAAIDLFTALDAWFAPTRMTDALRDLADELQRYSLTPSRVFRGTGGWTDVSETTRTLRVSGRFDEGAYVIASGSDGGALVLPGDYRGTFRLEKLRREHEYRWSGDDTACLGDVPLTSLMRAVESILLALEVGESLDPLDLLPHTKATWGRLAQLRVVERRPAPDGGKISKIELELHPEGIESEFPAFSRYLDAFARPVEMDVEIRDESGAVWMRITLARLVARLDLRSVDGEMAPLVGPPRTLPNDLYLQADLSTKAGPFRVGFRDLVAHLRFERSDERVSLVFLSGREPSWRIPVLVEPFLSGALRRPFEGDGVETRFVLRSEPGGRTLLQNDFRLEVEETWLLRRLAGSFGSEFDEDVERERRQFYEAAFRGLREDVLRLLARAGEGDAATAKDVGAAALSGP